MTIENKPASRLEKYLNYIATKEGEIPEEVGSRLELYLKAICERLSTEGGVASITVENVLTSTSTTNALSAAQGKVLNDALATKVPKDGNKVLSEVNFTSALKNKLDGLKNVTVENILTSTSTANALSSAQGKALNDKIAALEARVSALETPGI